MKILAIEASGLTAGCAVACDVKLIGDYTIQYQKTHSQTLVPMLDELKRMTELDLSTLDAIAITADILKKDCIVKLLVGCTEEETMRILEFLDQTEFQKAILVRRGNETPSWSNND